MIKIISTRTPSKILKPLANIPPKQPIRPTNKPTIENNPYGLTTDIIFPPNHFSYSDSILSCF